MGGGLANCSVTVVVLAEEPQSCHEVILMVPRVADCLSSFVCVCARVYFDIVFHLCIDTSPWLLY